MAISDRIESIEDHLKESYQELEGIGIDTTGVNNNLENIPKLLDGYWETLPKVTDEGTSITLDNTKEGKMKVLLKGNTYQDSTTGKNILGLTNGTYNPSSGTGISVTVNDNVITVSGTANGHNVTDIPLLKTIPTSVGTIMKSLNPTGTYTGVQTSLRASVPNTSVGLWSTDASNKSGTIDGEAYYFRIQVNDGISVNCTLKAQIELGSSATSFEKFTYGASPNPDYPQEVHTVSGDNEAEVCEKNLLNPSVFAQKVIDTGYNAYNTSTYDSTTGELNIMMGNAGVVFDKFRENKQYTIMIKYKSTTTSTASAVALNLRIRYTDNSVTNFNITPNTEGTYLLTTNSSKNVKAIEHQAGDSTGTRTLYLKESGIFEGVLTTDDFEAYKGASYPINLPVKNFFDFNTTHTNTYCSISIDNNTLTQTNSGTNSRSRWEINNLTIGQNYTLSFNYTNSNASTILAMIRNSADTTTITQTNSTTNTSGKESLTFTATETTQNIRLYSNATNTSNTSIVIFSNIQLEEGSKANSFTPYGTTPIELCKIGTYQDAFIKNSGKNLVDRSACDENKALIWTSGIPNAETGSLASDYIPVNIGDTIYCSYGCQKMFYDKNKNYLGNLKPDGTVEKTNSSPQLNNNFIVPNIEEIYYVRLGFRTAYATGVDLLNANIIANKGTSLAPYEPYGNGDWYLKKEIGKVMLGDLTWNVNQTGTINFFYLANFGSYGNYASLNSYVSHYKYASISSSSTEQGYMLLNDKYIRIRYGTEQSTSDFKDWLSTNNVLFYYPLSTPTYTKIEGTLASQLDAINGAKSYTPQTNISQNNNDMASVLNATALSNGTVTPSLQGIQTLSLGQNVDLQTQEPIEEQAEEVEEVEEQGEEI